MGKSQETFNKKEREKQKQKKKQDKLEKREERKANVEKGKSLDDMMAYIDENGNISSTPPDPKNVKKVKKEDIDLTYTRKSHEPEEVTRKGTVTFYNDAKGFGFIKDHVTQQSVFVHVNNIQTPIKENDKVTFETEMGHKGPSAIKVKKI